MENTRVFIAYRGESSGERQGKDFAKTLYGELNKEIDAETKYGKIYFSPKTERFANFKADIQRIMTNVKYFVLPLTKNFFEGFLSDKVNQEVNKDSITYIEMMTALRINETIEKEGSYPNRSENGKIEFIRVDFPGYSHNVELIQTIFGEYSDSISCLKGIDYNEEEVDKCIRIIADSICKRDYSVNPFYMRADAYNPNVFLTFKAETEDDNKFPFYERLYNVTRIKMLNFAGSGFVAGVSISKVYSSADPLRRWFERNLLNGKIEASIVLTNPHSYAAKDASKYKMYPGITSDKDKIIITNLNKLINFKNDNDKVDLSVFTTDICLPYGLMIVEHQNPSEDYIKVDLYAPVILSDNYRPSFYLFKNNSETRALYDFFVRNYEEIVQHYSQKIEGSENIDWLTQYTIVHRGKVSSTVHEHTREAFSKCIEEGHAIEVDLLFLNNKYILVYRDEDFNGRNLSEYNYWELEEIKEQDEEASINGVSLKQILGFEELLSYVNGRVPLLIEIKSNVYELNDQIKEIAQSVVQKLANYQGQYAIHSANPYVLRAIKDIDVMTACGQITQDFSCKNVPQELIDLHNNNRFIDIIRPDFISYNIEQLPNEEINNLCNNGSRRIPLIGWTAKTTASVRKARTFCDNVIREFS